MALNFVTGRNKPAVDRYFKILVYGDSGAGKTWLAASAPNPVILLTERNGEQSVSMSAPDAPYAIVSTADEVRDFVAGAMSGTFRSQGYDTLVIDGLTEIQRLLRDEIQRAKSEDAEFTFRDWGDLNEKMRRFMRTLRDLPYHVVCTALAESEMEGDIRHVFPAFQGRKLYSEVMQFFNAVGYVYRAPAEKQGEPMRHLVMFDGPQRYSVKNAHPLRGTRSGPVSAWIAEMATAAPLAPLARKAGAPEPAPVGDAVEGGAPDRRPDPAPALHNEGQDTAVPDAPGPDAGEAKASKGKAAGALPRRGRKADPAA